MEHKTENLQLPNNIVGLMDVSRLCREMDSLEDFLHQATVRQSGTPMSLPKLSKLFDELAATNELNLLQEQDRAQLKTFLDSVHGKAPRLHISFSADPSPLFLGRLVDYLRSSVHPKVLVQVGLQPNIGAGCVLRSTNKVFDMSLRNDFKKKRGLLLKYVTSLQSPNETPQAAAQPEASA